MRHALCFLIIYYSLLFCIFYGSGKASELFISYLEIPNLSNRETSHLLPSFPFDDPQNECEEGRETEILVLVTCSTVFLPWPLLLIFALVLADVVVLIFRVA